MYGYYTGADWPVMRMFGARTQGAASPNAEVPIRGDNEPRNSANSNVQEFGFGSAHPGIICSVFGDGCDALYFAVGGPDRPRPARKTRRPIGPIARQSLGRYDLRTDSLPGARRA